MNISGWQQALTLFFAVIPGFIYQGTRSALRGPSPNDREIGVRVLRALGVSGFLVLLYIALIGPRLKNVLTQPGFPFANPQPAAWILLGLIFVVPITSAVVLDRLQPMRRITNRWAKAGFSVYDPTPTAWDFATDQMQVGFVRVLTKESSWVGGYLGENSFLSGYPESREIFLEQAWLLDEGGAFVEPVNGSLGVWIRCEDALLVQFLAEAVNEVVAREDPQ
ncbi:hypothetical protein DQP55_08865 [Mycolicibacterium sp. GF69]|uniref:DUF6338 family protein n=1 Tax=Mycolicibacterium sp. GF69 TaxID=2267251 RepID=UPI000DCB2B5F|nr:DUF6338 family protein [Mycolicibacterium sp. GF69]RAV14660.1 hypothetical protein DQP55_08865 [Mycolicibacterium sp. GF69]